MLKKLRATLCMVLIVSMMMSGAAVGEVIPWEYERTAEEGIGWEYGLMLQPGETYTRSDLDVLRAILGGLIRSENGVVYDCYLTLQYITQSITSSDESVVTAEFEKYIHEGDTITGLPGIYTTEELDVVLHAHNPGAATVTAVCGTHNTDDGSMELHTFVYHVVVGETQPLEISLSSNAPLKNNRHEITLKTGTFALSNTTQWLQAGTGISLGLMGNPLLGAMVSAMYTIGMTKANIDLSSIKRVEISPSPVTMTISVHNPNSFDIDSAQILAAPEKGSASLSMKDIFSSTSLYLSIPSNGTIEQTYTVFPEITYNGQHYDYNIAVQAYYLSESGEKIVSEASLPMHVLCLLEDKEAYYKTDSK